jgi:type I restriction enzyme S subunit
MTSVSVHDIRRELVATSFRQLGDGVSDFAIEHLPELIDEQKDVEDLRVAISALAVRGGLSERLDSDDDIDDLLDELADGKAAVAGTASRARRAGLFTASTPDQEVDVPAGWRSVPLGDITAMYNGFAFKSHAWKSVGLPIVRIQNLNKLHAPFNHAEPGTVLDRNKIDTGDVLLSWSGTPGTSFGVFIWTRGPAALNQHIFKCERYGRVNTRYFQIAVNEGIRKSLGRAHGGVGLKHLTKKMLDAMPIPLPPRQEQNRIVEAVDQLDERISRLRELLAPVGANHAVGISSLEDDAEE